MGITIKYQGLQGSPLLVTPEGRLPSVPTGGPSPLELRSPGELYLGQGGPQLRLEIFQQEQDLVLAEVGRRVDDLTQSIDDLPVPSGNLAALAKTALSSQPEALSPSVDQQATAPTTHLVQVQWPAQGGVILSSPQNPIAPISLADGAHTFTLTVDGVAHELSVKAVNGSIPDDQSLLGSLAQPATDTQEEFLRRLANAISGADPGVKASLEYSFQDAYDPAASGRGPLNRVVRLKVESVKPGRGPEFSLADAQGSAISSYHLESQTPPRSARVLADGVLRDLDQNQLSLDQGHLTAEIKGATVGLAQVTVQQGPGALTQALGAVVAKYNDLVSYLDTHADVLRPALRDRLVRPLEERARTLNSLGLKATPQGRLTPTGQFLQQMSGDQTSVRQALLGSKGWLTTLNKKLKQIKSTGYHQFAKDLSSTVEEQSLKAWDALTLVRDSIINGYY